MKDLKNIIIELWELFFPMLIRTFLSLVILTFIVLPSVKNLLQSKSLMFFQRFIDNSRIILTSLKLESFLGVYLLVIFILVCYTFNAILAFINSIFRISIYWRGYNGVSPYSFSKLSRYFTNVKDTRGLEAEIQKLFSLGIKDNKHKLADGEKWFSEKLTKFGKYTDILTFELIFSIIFSAICWNYISVGKLAITLVLIVFSIFFTLSRTALEVRSHYNQMLYKIELMMLESVVPSDSEQSKALETKLLNEASKRWWGISIRLIGDIKETIRNFGSLEIK